MADHHAGLLVAIKVFVSHATADSRIAEAVLRFVQRCVSIPHEEIRCTSVAGYKPHLGTSLTTLRDELRDCVYVIAILSPRSISSTWVLFELGATWGAEKKFAPIIHPAHEPTEILPGPMLTDLAVKLTDEEGMLQMVDELALALGVRVNVPATRGAVEDLLRVASSLTTEPAVAAEPPRERKNDAPATDLGPSDETGRQDARPAAARSPLYLSVSQPNVGDTDPFFVDMTFMLRNESTQTLYNISMSLVAYGQEPGQDIRDRFDDLLDIVPTDEGGRRPKLYSLNASPAKSAAALPSNKEVGGLLPRLKPIRFRTGSAAWWAGAVQVTCDGREPEWFQVVMWVSSRGEVTCRMIDTSGARPVVALNWSPEVATTPTLAGMSPPVAWMTPSMRADFGIVGALTYDPPERSPRFAVEVPPLAVKLLNFKLDYDHSEGQRLCFDLSLTHVGDANIRGLSAYVIGHGAKPKRHPDQEQILSGIDVKSAYGAPNLASVVQMSFQGENRMRAETFHPGDALTTSLTPSGAISARSHDEVWWAGCIRVSAEKGLSEPIWIQLLMRVHAKGTPKVWLRAGRDSNRVVAAHVLNHHGRWTGPTDWFEHEDDHVTFHYGISPSVASS